MKKSKEKLIKEAKFVYEKLQETKKLYARMDEITQDLVDLGLQAEEGVILVDNFKNRNIQWKAAAFRRYELSFDLPTEK